MHRNLWEELEHRRIWRVLYQTEPMPMILQWKLPGGCKPASLGPGLEGSAPTCGLNVGLRSAGRCKAEPPLDEVWDYSAANVEACASPGRRVIWRHVPVGHVSATSTGHDATSSAGSPKDERLLFLGNPAVSRERRACYASLKRLLPRRSLRYTTRTWDEVKLGELLRKHAFFVNIHKSCGDALSPMEGFRMASLLSAGGLVISERSHPRDELEYRSLVTFADNMSQIAQIYLRQLEQHRRRPADPGSGALDGAALAARAAARRKRFARRFDARRVLRRAGVLSSQKVT